MKDYIQISRGQVWYLVQSEDLKGRTDVGSIQMKDRPWLVVSCDENNKHSPTYNCLPLTTKPKDHLPCHVYFKYKGRDQVIECEQIMTKSVNDFTKSGRYMYTLSKEMMDQVNEALAGQLGLSIRLPDLSVIADIVERIIQKKVQDAEERYTAIAGDFILGIMRTSEGVGPLEDGVEEDPEDNVVEEFLSALEEEGLPYSGPVEITPEVEHKEEKPAMEVSASKRQTGRAPKGSVWPREDMQEFLTDCDTMKTGDVMKKWGLNSKRTVNVYRSRFRSEIYSN